METGLKDIQDSLVRFKDLVTEQEEAVTLIGKELSHTNQRVSDLKGDLDRLEKLLEQSSNSQVEIKNQMDAMGNDQKVLLEQQQNIIENHSQLENLIKSSTKSPKRTSPRKQRVSLVAKRRAMHFRF